MATSVTSRTSTQLASTEADIRLGMLNTLLTTPHRDLASVRPMHEQMIKQDPLFYVRLAAWYNATGEVRDQKEMFIINLCLSDFPSHKDVGLAMLRELPPYQVERVVSFISGKKVKKIERTTTGAGKNKKTSTKVVGLEDVGLFRNVPRSVVTEVTRYLREREASNEFFDSAVKTARKSMHRLYALLHIKPSDRAKQILFEKNPPKDSSLYAIKELRRVTTPAEQAKIIVDNKVPYRIACTIVKAMTPTVIAALVEVMSGQELLNNLNSLKERGAFDNADIKAMIEKKLEAAKTGTRIAALKTTVAKDASNLDEETQKKVAAIGDAQLKSKGRIKRPTALIIDKSGSMAAAIKVGQSIASMISTVMDDAFYVYACDVMAYPIVPAGEARDLPAWEKAFAGIGASGGTSCGIGIEMLRRNKQKVEQIIMVTDECETSSPPFLTTLQNYMKEMNVEPHIVFVKCGGYSELLETRCKNASISYDAYEFKGDFYSLPGLIPYLTRPSKMDLLIDIMQWDLPVRKAS